MAWPAGWHVAVVDQTESTNADLLAAGRGGAPDRTVLAAAHQTAGRGRLDRAWTAPPYANLLVSLLFRDTLPGSAHELTQRVALAAAQAARALTGADARLKWPNDLLIDDRKLAGVLAQAETGPGPDGSTVIRHVVVGIGINIGWAPPGAARLADAPGSRLGGHGDLVHPLDVLGSMLQHYDALPAVIHEGYRAALATLGRRVRVELPGGRTVAGIAVDVDADGRLVVEEPAGVVHHFDVGDVVHVRATV